MVLRASATHATVSLSAPATPGGELSFGLWYDTEAGYDVLTLEASTDGGTTWAPVPFAIRSGPATDGTISGFGGRRWHHAEAALPEGDDVLVRWRYANDAANQGRGVYVDRVRVDGKRISDDVVHGRRLAAVAELRPLQGGLLVIAVTVDSKVTFLHARRSPGHDGPDPRPAALPGSGRAPGRRTGPRRPGRGRRLHDQLAGPRLRDLGDDRDPVLPGRRVHRLPRAPAGPGRRARPQRRRREPPAHRRYRRR